MPVELEAPRPSTAPCPNCGDRNTVLLKSISAMSDVDYCGCPRCRQVWIQPRLEAQPKLEKTSEIGAR